MSTNMNPFLLSTLSKTLSYSAVTSLLLSNIFVYWSIGLRPIKDFFFNLSEYLEYTYYIYHFQIVHYMQILLPRCKITELA